MFDSSRFIIASFIATSAFALSSCGTLSNQVAGGQSAQTPAASPSIVEAGVGPRPLGTANTEMKTERPEAPSQLLVSSVRVGKHDSFERVVFELSGHGTPGWFVDFTQKPTQQGSGNNIPFEGTTALNVNIDGTVLPFELGVKDPNIGVVPGAGGTVTQVVSAGTFEGRSQFIIGLNGKHPYSVQVLNNPTRVVIDILN